jgi:hypothetical protein
MNTPSKPANKFPTKSNLKIVSVTCVAVIHNTQSNNFRLTFEIFSKGLNGEIATVILLPANAEPSPTSGNTSSLSFWPFNQLSTNKGIANYGPFPLLEGNFDIVFEVPEADLPRGYLGPPLQAFYLLLEVGSRLTMSPEFTFNLPPSNPCDCGDGLEKLFSCSKIKRYTYPYGPLFGGQKILAMAKYSRWDSLRAAPYNLTDSEQTIISVMASQEGNFDTVQAIDDQIATVGAMQKTIRIDDEGEFSKQMYEFGTEQAALYKCLVEDCGWSVTKGKNKKGVTIYPTTYTHPKTKKLYQGQELFDLIHEGYSKDNYGKPVSNNILAPLIALGRNEKFQDKQVADFVKRLRLILAKKPNRYNATVGEYFKSNFGRTLLLDEHVNRSSHIEPYVAAALDELISKNSSISPDPSKWLLKHDEYESKLIEIYGPLRDKSIKDPPPGKKSYGGMDNGVKRYNEIKAYFDSH